MRQRMRLIDADALLKEFSTRAVSARNWKEEALNSGNEELVIRADATLAFLSEVKLTIDNIPTVEQSYQMPKNYIKNKLDYMQAKTSWEADNND